MEKETLKLTLSVLNGNVSGEKVLLSNKQICLFPNKCLLNKLRVFPAPNYSKSQHFL